MREGCSIRSIAITVVIAMLPVAAVPAAAVLTDITPPTGVGLDRGIALLRCTADSGASWYSRGAVIAIGATDREVFLTVGHGMPEALDAIVRDCRVVGRHGQRLKIEHVWRPASVTGGTESDWSVLLLKGRLKGDVARLRVASLSEEAVATLSAAQTPVRLLLRHAPVTQGDCRLRVASAVAAPWLVTYSCLSAPGLSGSPIAVGVGGEAVIIGVHLGWSFSIADFTGPGHVTSVARVIDGTIVEALKAASARAAPRALGDATVSSRRAPRSSR
jgi:hypothetical protein